MEMGTFWSKTHLQLIVQLQKKQNLKHYTNSKSASKIHKRQPDGDRCLGRRNLLLSQATGTRLRHDPCLAAVVPKRFTQTELDSGGNFTALENNSLLTASSVTGIGNLQDEDKSYGGK